jgi:hypothetical protein
MFSRASPEHDEDERDREKSANKRAKNRAP